jgi:hypothetical protein
MKSNITHKVGLLLLFSITLGASAGAQQAWTRAKGGYYVQIGGSYLQANSLLNGTSKPIPLNREVTDITLQAYAEYGLTQKITLSAQVPFKLLSVKNTVGQPALQDGSLQAFSNLVGAATVNFYQKKGCVVSGKTLISLPTARFSAETGLRSGFDALSAAPSILAGIGRNKFFSSAELGYVFRSNDYSDRLFAAWQIGTFLGKNKRLLAILGLEYMDSMENGSFEDGSASTTGLYLDEQSYLSPNLKFGFKATPKVMLWLSAGGGLGAVTRNVAASPGLSFSVSYQPK